jgi:hypothetical protein
MPSPLADLARRYRFNERLLGMVSEGLTPVEWAQAPGVKGGNSAHWILAHLVVQRRGLARKLGETAPAEPWEAAFKPGSNGTLAPDTPAPAALLGTFTALGDRIGARLTTLEPAAGEAPWGTTFPDGGTTVAAGAHFLYFHETYHLGQIGLVRRILGRPGFV